MALGKKAMAFALILLGGSAAGTGVSAQNSVVGVDLSGTYELDHVDCFDNTGDLVSIATLDGYSESVTIDGNEVTFLTGGGACLGISQGTVVFRESNTFRSSEFEWSVLGGSCAISAEIQIESENGVDEVPITIPLRDNRTEPAASGEYFFDEVSGELLIDPFTPVTVGDADCLVVYIPT